MGLITSLSNAVSGLRTNQDSISILSRNVANAGTPGYHRQSLNIIDHNTVNSTYARSAGVDRAFSLSLQTYYNRQVSDTASATVQASYLNKLQGFLGKPGSAGSLDAMFGSFKNSLQALATSPDDYPTRATAVSQAQAMAQRLNELSNTVQDLRQETEMRLGNNVTEVNAMLVSLNEVNNRMLDLGMTDTARASLHDQRDRLVASVAEIIDVQANYRPDGTVALMTRSGVGLLDAGYSTFKFTTSGSLSASSQAGGAEGMDSVGTLTLTTPSGLSIDLVKQGVLQGGEMAGLVQLRDKTLVEAQNQLDEIAAGLAAAFSTISTPGTAATDAGTATGLKVSLAGLQPGNDIQLTYTVNGVEQRARLVHSDHGEPYTDASGQRVIPINFAALSDPTKLGEAQDLLAYELRGFQVDLSASDLTVLNTAAGDGKSVTGLVARTTATGLLDGQNAMALFTDGDAAFTNNLDTYPPQKVGLASRIRINGAVLADNRLLVQTNAGQTLGDAARPEYVLNQLKNMSFVSGGSPAQNVGRHQLNGSVEQLIGQVLNYQGTTIGSALTAQSNRQLTLDTITTQMESEYGVNIDEEMARLTELQSAYAANARVVSVVKELLDALFAST